MPPDYDDVDSGQPRTSGMAVASLILGLLSFCTSFLTGGPAVVLAIMSLIAIKNSNGQVRGTGLAIGGLITGLLGTLAVFVLPLLLLPAVQKVHESAARMQSSNNLKMMGLAMHSYNDDKGQLPPQAITGKESNKPLLSWRVAILPYLGENALYQQFKLDEPWDSTNNKPLLNLRPKVYAHPAGRDPDPTMTYYQVFVGKGTAFEPGRKVKLPIDFPDGTPNTILVVEAANPVPWTKPDDLTFDPDGPLPALGGLSAGGFNVLAADGSTRFLGQKLSEQTVRGAITRNGSEVLGPDW
jgi:Protein of unknown function (DUF1559)/Domain of unknown function (DUF4190)